MMLKNGTKVVTQAGEGIIKSTIGGYYGYYYIVEFPDGKRGRFLDKEVKKI